MNHTTKTTLRQQAPAGLPWTSLSLLLAVSWMLSIAFTTQEGHLQDTPDTASAARLHPFIQLGLLSGLQLAERDSSFIGTLDLTERLAKVSTFGR